MADDNKKSDKVVVLFQCTVPANNLEVDRWWHEISDDMVHSKAIGDRVMLTISEERLDLLTKLVMTDRITPENTYYVVLPPERIGGIDRIVPGSCFDAEEEKHRNGGGCSVPLNALPSQIDLASYPSGT